MRTGAEVDAALSRRRAARRRAEPPAARSSRAGAVVLAAGAWSGGADWLPRQARPPVRPVKGQILELRDARRRRRRASRILASERVYLVPRPDGRLIVGATVEEQGFDTAVTAGGVHELLREAYRLLPDVAEMELVEAAAGLRPGTPDNLPLVGPGPVEGLLWATGHYRNGDPAGAARRRDGSPPLRRRRTVVEVAGDEDRAEREAAASSPTGRRSPTRCGERRRRGRARGRRRRSTARSCRAASGTRRAAQGGQRSRFWRRSRAAPRPRRDLGARRPRVDLAPDRRDRRLPLARADGGGAGRLRGGDRHRRPAPHRPRRQGLGARRDRQARPLRPAQHGRLLHRPRRGPHRAARPRGVRDRLDQARGDRRRPHPLPRRGRAARRRRDPGRRGLHRPPLHQRRPDPRPPPGGGRLRRGDAARLADRLRRRHPQPLQRRDHRRARRRSR